jgi:hypothetical protein
MISYLLDATEYSKSFNPKKLIRSFGNSFKKNRQKFQFTREAESAYSK